MFYFLVDHYFLERKTNFIINFRKQKLKLRLQECQKPKYIFQAVGNFRSQFTTPWSPIRNTRVKLPHVLTISHLNVLFFLSVIFLRQSPRCAILSSNQTFCSVSKTHLTIDPEHYSICLQDIHTRTVGGQLRSNSSHGSPTPTNCSKRKDLSRDKTPHRLLQDAYFLPKQIRPYTPYLQ